MEDDIDIYEDLPIYEIKSSDDLVANNSDSIILENNELKKQIETLTVKLEDCGKINKTLEVNLFSLLKTAKAEIARKDKMIDELRKKLDDVTFKRGSQTKFQYVPRNPSFHETVVNNRHYESTGIRSVPKEKELEVFEGTDSSTHRHVREPPNKSTLTPITVFGERLRKRIADEQSIERKDRQMRKLTVIDSDKENGNSNACIITEISSPLVAHLSSGDSLRIPTEAIRLNDKMEERLNECVNKRMNENTTVPVPLKRFKSEGSEHFRDTIVAKVVTKIDAKIDAKVDAKVDAQIDAKIDAKQQDEVMMETKAQHQLINHIDRVKSSSYFSEKQEISKSANTDESNSESGRHRSFTVDSVKRREKGDSKERDDKAKDKKDINDHRQLSRGYRKVDRSSMFALKDRERTTRRDTELVKREERRASDEKHRRNRQKEREDQRCAVECRSRSKFTSYTKPRKERYEKHSVSEEKRYDFRVTGGKQPVTVGNDETRDLRNTVRRHAAFDRECNNAKAENSRRDCAPVRERCENKTRIREEKKGEKSEEYSREKGSVSEKFEERPKSWDTKVKQFAQMDRKDNRNATAWEGKAQSLANKVENDSSKDLEDGEIASIIAEKIDRNHSGELDSLSLVDANANANASQSIDILGKESTTDLLKVSESPHSSFRSTIVSDHPTDTTTPCGKTVECSENNVENVENIEKFIRDSASNSESGTALLHDDAPKGDGLSKFDVFQSINSTRNDDYALSSRADHFESSRAILSGLLTPLTNVNTGDTFDHRRHEAKGIPNELAAAEAAGARTKTEETRVPAVEKLYENCCTETIQPETCSLQSSTNCLEGGKKEEAGLVQASSEDIEIKENCARDTVTLEFRETVASNEETNDNTLLHTETDARVELVTDNEKTMDSIYQDANKEKMGRKDRESKRKVDVTKEWNGRTAREKKSKRTGDEKAEGGEAKKSEKVRKERVSGDRNVKDASMNVHGKIVVFVRRRKPVCLEDNNANMTVLANDSREIGITSLPSSAVVEENLRNPKNIDRTDIGKEIKTG